MEEQGKKAKQIRSPRNSFSLSGRIPERMCRGEARREEPLGPPNPRPAGLLWVCTAYWQGNCLGEPSEKGPPASW